MPIRINLLAEQQAAEEARRRDPVKRAYWIAGALVALVLIWSGRLQLQIFSANSSLAAEEATWRRMETEFLQVSNNTRESNLIRDKLESLQRHVTNRFLWAPPLSALQHVADDHVRVVSFSGTVLYKAEPEIVASTNIVAPVPTKSLWKFWAAPPVIDIDPNIRAALQALTNKAEFLRFQSELIVTTNVTRTPIQVVGKLDVKKPETVAERAALIVRARDYSTPPGSRVDKFNHALTNHPYFVRFLGRTNNIVQPEIRPDQDAADRINPNDWYIPFTVEFRFPERIRSNE